MYELVERARRLEDLMVGHVTGTWQTSDDEYRELRRLLMSQPKLHRLLPDFVRECRDLRAFWDLMKSKTSTYRERRALIRGAFAGLLDALDADQNHPSDESLLS